MKKILYVLGCISILSGSVSSVVACKQTKKTSDNLKENIFHKKYWSRLNNSDSIIHNDFSKLNAKQIESLMNKKAYEYTIPNPTKVLKSTLAKKILDNNIRKLEYKPYVDIGIVEDNVEYLLKDKGVNGAYWKEALASIKKRNGEQIIYNDLAHFKNKGIASKFVLGFMQNDSSSPELAPAWNATPVHDTNQSGKWYQDRLDKWQQNGLNLQEDITISFGPFANSFWHTAYLNNYTELDLANAFREITNKYQTKSFDFYFAAPYNRINSEYAEATKLLAGALKILLEQDQTYRIRLSIITGNDGLVIPTPVNTPYNGSKKQVGSDVYPLYEFTRFLGLNFTLNLVSAYLQPNDNTINDRWEVPALKNAIEATHKTWKGMLNIFSTENIATQNDQLIYNRMGVTPWIGTRAELPQYKFDAKDAIEIRKYAEAKGMADMSMFYLSRDFPSHFQANEAGNADQNPLDQNIRSGTGYESFTYSKILSGQQTIAPVEPTDKNQILQLKGALDYHHIILNNKDLDQYTNPSDNWSGGEDITIDPKEFWRARKNRYFSWDQANPNRLNGTTANHVTTKTNEISSTYFTPYIDNGLWEGNDLDGIINGKQTPDYTQQNVPNFNNKVNNFEALTLSFVQQVKNHSNYLDFSIAGIETGNDGYEYWEQNQLKQKVLDPLNKHNTFDKLRVSYGGLSTGHNPAENAWNAAYNQYYHKNESNMETAVHVLAEKFAMFNQNLATLAGGYRDPIKARQAMPMSLDFDIERSAQFTLKENRLLAKTLAFMKKQNRKWTFSLTLPVMPDGLTDICRKLVKIFIEEYKKQGLSHDDLPIINIMAMDYGDGIYNQARNRGQTNFDLAKAATISTRRNLKEIINKVYDVNINNKTLNRFLGITPMIGVNDTVEGVFTLEDAKELYNWAHAENLAFISMWSVNDDKGFLGQQPSAKTITSHGLNYLREWDFMRAFSGDWQAWVKQPARDPFRNKIKKILS
ncbi:bifunctional chitinase/lysozyme [Spiroplasma sp. NBRC 100390]|uniref:hypothetical protein n=1 Tax=unclassified Spiroplasma TaxID=2637901 RepID=UPI0008929E7E|nr:MULTISPECIES: hypothetical protein [unclassified Spiroplasma]AOX43882.1 bifunctional chitinase/lysozyme [Spiroplasma sp. TU-14]APE13352.1 bifunctional chitinase/lysozyme [Spiroplasma sp. NBRC 100390]